MTLARGIPPAFMPGVALYYSLLVGAVVGLQLFEPVQHGLTFNSMAINLLQGRFDVDPDAIGAEAFVRDGRTYAYFGIFPALLRLPLVPFLDLSSVDVSRVSIVLALTVGALATARAVATGMQALPANDLRDLIRDRLVLASVLSGPPILLAMQTAIYEEAIGWAWAMASIFVASAIGTITNRSDATTGRLSVMAIAAGLCLLARPSTALGLHVGLALLMMWALTEPDGTTAPAYRRLLRRLPSMRFMVPAALILCFGAAAGFVNWSRWGNPFVVADMRAYVHFLEAFPERLHRLDTYGLFSVQRIPYGLAYYFVPVWMMRLDGEYPLRARIIELFDSYEFPAASLLISDALTVVLAAAGIGALVRGRTAPFARPGAAALVIGVSLSPAMMLAAWYMAFRYRAEFAPLLTCLACIGAASWVARQGQWSARKQGIIRVTVIVLFFVQIFSSHLFAVTSAVLPRGMGLQHLTVGVPELYRLCFTTGCPSPTE